MACNTLSLASSVAGVAAYAPLSSACAPFVAPPAAPAMLSPLASSSSSSAKPLSISCSLSEKKDTPASSSSSMGKALLTGLVAAGAALSVFTADTVSAPPSAFAASGPGTSGAERTAQKAQDLLKAADKLNVQEAPKRFGPGRVSGANQDAGKISQDAGGKALSQIQDGISSIAGSLSGTKGQVESTFSGKTGQVQSAAQNVASEAQNKLDDATGNSGPGGLFSSIKDTVQGIKDSVAQKDADAKKTLEEATSNVQSTVQ